MYFSPILSTLGLESITFHNPNPLQLEPNLKGNEFQFSYLTEERKLNNYHSLYHICWTAQLYRGYPYHVQTQRCQYSMQGDNIDVMPGNTKIQSSINFETLKGTVSRLQDMAESIKLLGY